MFTVAVVMTAALAIPANTAIFSIVNAVLVRPLPFGDPDRLMQVAERNDRLNIPSFGVSALNFLSWREQTKAFQDLGGGRVRHIHAERRRRSRAGTGQSHQCGADAGPCAGQRADDEQWVSNTAAQPRLNAMLLGVFAGVALVIAAIGIYGVLAFSVNQRTRRSVCVLRSAPRPAVSFASLSGKA